MKKFSVVFAFFCAIFLFAACNGGKDSESETAKLGGSCSVKNSEILVCKDSLWHTKKSATSISENTAGRIQTAHSAV